MNKKGVLYMTLLNSLNANATLLATKLIMKEGESAGSTGEDCEFPKLLL